MNSSKTDSRAWKIRAISLFIALSLAVTWYYQVKRWATGVPGNGTNMWSFDAMSKSQYHMPDLGVWRARIGGLWIAGKLYDSAVTNGTINVDDYKAQKIILLSTPTQDANGSPQGTYLYIDDYQHVFGLYHACWLFLFFVVLIIFLENPLMVMFGTLAGMMYTLTPAAVYYAYAWDMPSMLFFTLGFFLWRRKQYNWMLATIFIGCPFKETTAVIAILYFFTDLPLKKRFIYFGVAAVLTFFQKMFIMEMLYHIPTIHTQDYTLMANIKEFFSLKWNHFIFVNAGTLMVAVFLPARTRVQWGTKALIVVFWGCQALAGSFNEFRIMLETLPIALIYLADYLNLTTLPQAAEGASPLKPQPKNPKTR